MLETTPKGNKTSDNIHIEDVLLNKTIYIYIYETIICNTSTYLKAKKN